MTHQKRDNIDKIERKFENIWLKNKPLITSGKIIPTGFFQGKPIEHEYILALVAVIKSQRPNIIPQIVAIQNKLRSIDPTHYYYPTSSLHITVAGCTPFYKKRTAISLGRINRIFKICNELIQDWNEPFHLHVVGLNAIPYSIFLQVFNSDGTFTKFRHELISALKAFGENPIEQFNTGEIHINIMKFTHNNSAKLKQFVSTLEDLRDFRIGLLIVDKIELDITDKIQFPSNTSVIHEFNLRK